MVLDAPWDRGLGGPRIQIELGEQFSKLGHIVHAYAWEHAFPQPAKVPALESFSRSFARKATAWIKQHGREYDIIDARAGSLGASKGNLAFSGLLVARSTGLLPIYEREFLAADRATRAGRSRLVTRIPRRVQRTLVKRRNMRSIHCCDLLNVENSDEETFAREVGLSDRTVKLFHGLTRERFAAFSESRLSPEERLERPTVAFIGAWSRRKGSADMARLIEAVRARMPDVAFRFLGTGVHPEIVLADCGRHHRNVEVVQTFESDELPALLADATVGILPSYVEGFPFSVIEMLASGLPVVAYDAPGARETLPSIDRSLLVNRGDPGALGDKVVELLADEENLDELSARSVALADSLRWEDIASETLDIYAERLSHVKDRSA